MRVCIVAEGCYPYVVGGVSAWVHNMIRAFPEHEFIILAIVANRSMRGKFAYELPNNVAEVHELYLEDADWGKKKHRSRKMNKDQFRALQSLLLNQDIEWEYLFNWFQRPDVSLGDFLMGEDFLNAVTYDYKLHYSQIVFSDFLWMMRSIYLPLFFTLKMKVPKADLYHCVSTGYAGVLGSMAKYIHGGRLLISEHGIYTREREEELIKSKWAQGIYKNIWIEQFRKMSRLAYGSANIVTSLYEEARELQMELGCPAEKTRLTPNGVSLERLQDLPSEKEEEDRIYIGAVIRISPVKDVKTMIQAFHFAKAKEPALKLWIMGPWDEDEAYAEECFQLADGIGEPDIVFTGKIDVRDYLGKMDMTILTSISEGQPLAVLESFAARKPVIATDVGNCRGLIAGEKDDFGPAGVITHVMNVEEIAYAILRLARDEKLRRQMGENGYQRVKEGYRLDQMYHIYGDIYEDFAKDLGAS